MTQTITQHKNKQYGIDALLAGVFCLFVFTTIVLNITNYYVICNILFFLFFLLSIVKQFRVNIRLSGSDWSFLLLSLVAVVSFFLHGMTSTGLSSVYSIVSQVLLFIVGTKTIKKQYLDSIINSFILGSFGLAAVALIQGIQSGGRLTSSLANSNVIGEYICFSCLFILNRIETKSLYRFIIYLIGIYIILLTRSRSSLIIVLVFSSIVLIAKRKQFGKMKRALMFFLVAVALLVAISSGFIFRYTSRFSDIARYFNGDSSQQLNSVSIRILFKKIGLREIVKNPILGHGIGSTRDFLKQYFNIDYYFHDNFIELAFELGLFGAICYYIPLFSILFQRKTYADFFARVLAMTVISFGFFDSTYHNKVFYIVLIIMFLQNLSSLAQKNSLQELEKE